MSSIKSFEFNPIIAFSPLSFMAGASDKFHTDGVLDHTKLGADPSELQCIKFFTNLVKTKDVSKVLPMVLNSGKAINDFGFYDACNNSTETRYITLRPVETKYEKKLFYGACLPAYCDIGTINESFTQYFSAQVAPGIEEINGVPKDSMHFVAVDPGFNTTEGLSATGFLTISLVCALGVISCIGSCFNASVAKRDGNWARSLRNRNDEYENMMDDQEVRRDSALIKFTRSFDFFENLKRIFADNEKAYFQLTYLDGFRCLALVYITFANDYIARFNISQNITDIYSVERFKKSGIYCFLVGSQYAIEILLFTSGVANFLSFSQKLKEQKKRGLFGAITFYIKSVIYKWLCLAPLFFVVASIYWCVIPATISGPISSVFNDFSDTCDNGGFWSSVFMFGNIDIRNQCMTWCWYIAIEFQAFLALLVAVIAFRSNKTAGFLILALWIAVAVGMSYFMWFDIEKIKLPVNAIPRESIHDQYMIYYFAQSFTRWSTYMLGGAFAGMLIIYKDRLDGTFASNPISMCELDKEEVYANCESDQPALSIPSFLNNEENGAEQKMTPITTYSWVGELFCTIFGLGLIALPVILYRPYQNQANEKEGENWDRLSQASFAIFGSWSVIAGLVILGLPTLFEKKTIATMFFGGSFWAPLSRLVIGFYIIHMALIQYNIAQSWSNQYIDSFVIQNFMFADLFFGFLLSIVFVCSIELPISR